MSWEGSSATKYSIPWVNVLVESGGKVDVYREVVEAGFCISGNAIK